jgi:hypothetical protein
MEFAALKSVICAEPTGILGYLFPPWPTCFQTTLRFSVPDTVPRARASPGSSSQALRSPSEFVTAPNLADSLSSLSHLPWSLFPLRDISRENLLSSELSHAQLCSALSVSRALDGLPLSLPRGLVSSHYHVRDSPFRGFPHHLAESPLRRPVPSWHWLAFSSSRVAPTVQIGPPALQGLNPGSDPSRQTGGLVLLTVRSPLKFSLPRAFLQLPWRRLPRPLRS